MFGRLIICAAAMMLAAPQIAAAQTLWRVEGLSQPESVLFDEARDRLIVSEINGHPGEADGVGGLALLSLEGEIISRHWVRGLSAPKGMAILGDELLVSDLQQIHVIDLNSGAVLASHAAPGAQFLNDVSAHGGAAYISDLLGNAIWRYQNGALSLWLEDAALSHPNGVWAEEGRLLVGAWGQGLRDDFSTQTPGGLLSVDLDTKKISQFSPNLGNLDGVARFGEGYVVNDWMTGEVFMVSAAGAARRAAALAPGLADISAAQEPQVIYAPLMHDGAVEAVRLP